MRLACPSCRRPFNATPEQGGQKVECPQCGQRLRVPLPPTAAERTAVALEEHAPVLVDPVEEPSPPRRRREDSDNDGPRLRCPFCGHVGPPVDETKVSTGGWIAFWVLLLSLIGILFCWVGLLMRERVRSCENCGTRLGGG